MIAKRYSMRVDYGQGFGSAVVEEYEDEDGRWIDYDDHLEALRILNIAIAERDKHANAQGKVKALYPQAHCAPLANADFPEFYAIRATRDEWTETLATGPTPDAAWINAVDIRGG